MQFEVAKSTMQEFALTQQSGFFLHVAALLKISIGFVSTHCDTSLFDVNFLRSQVNISSHGAEQQHWMGKCTFWGTELQSTCAGCCRAEGVETKCKCAQT